MTWAMSLAVAASYLVGSIPTGYLVVKQLTQTDVRATGSGSIGATNVTRAAGKGAGRLVFIADVLKGVLAVLVVAPTLVHPVTPTVQLLCGMSAVLGHDFPVFLKFRGGKGVATTIGVLVGTMPLVAAVSLAVWLISFLIWRYVSLGSLAAALAIPLAQLMTGQPPASTRLGTLLALLIIVRHYANIRRLLEGRESRVGRHPVERPREGD